MSGFAVVIVTHNSQDVVGRCIDSCLAAGAAEIVVVDNASPDDTCREVRLCSQVYLVQNTENLGFAAAVNQGIASTEAPLILVLNPDTELLGGVEALTAACKDPKLAAAAGMLIGEDGRAQSGFNIRRFPTPAALALEVLGISRVWPGNPINRRYRCLDLDLTLPARVEQPAAAFLIIRRDAWEAIGGLDEGFHPVWFEDVDFCKRLHSAGYSIQYVPEARARHAGGHSVRKISFGCRQVYWYASLLKYASKHFTRLQNIGVSACVMLGAVPRVITGIFQEQSFQPISVFARVVRLAVSNLTWSRAGEAVNSPVAFVKDRRDSRVTQNSTVE